MIQNVSAKLILGLPLVAFAHVSVAQQTALHYEPSTVQLSGTVKLERHYGPPNFGASPRTDAVYTVPILLLKTPVTVQGDTAGPSPVNTDTFRDVGRMQLVFGTPGTKLAALNGEPVTVTGTLFEKITGGHYTDVLVQVRSFSLGESKTR